jgi:hypothetical protein
VTLPAAASLDARVEGLSSSGNPTSISHHVIPPFRPGLKGPGSSLLGDLEDDVWRRVLMKLNGHVIADKIQVALLLIVHPRDALKMFRNYLGVPLAKLATQDQAQ